MKKGITLVALVIMIVILVILAGVTIVQLNNKGLLKNAKLAREKYTNSQKEENTVLDDYLNKIDNLEIAGNGRDTVTIDREEYNQLIKRIEKLEQSTSNIELDNSNMVDISSYWDSNNPYVFEKNGVIEIQYSSSSSGSYFLSIHLSDYPYVPYLNDCNWGTGKSYSKIVNKGQTIYFSGNRQNLMAYFIPFK